MLGTQTGTQICVVETIGGLTDVKAHQEAVDKVGNRELSYGFQIVSATTTASSIPSSEGQAIHRITTIVFTPCHQ